MKNLYELLRKLLLIFLFLFFFFPDVVPLFAQKTKNNQRFLIWQQRADILTDGIIKIPGSFRILSGPFI